MAVFLGVERHQPIDLLTHWIYFAFFLCAFNCNFKALLFMIGNRDRTPLEDMAESAESEVEARRAFLKNCAKYAAATPPAIALLLSVGNAKAQVFTSDDPQCQEPGNPTNPPQCPGAPEGATEGATDPELTDPEAEAQ